MTRFLSMALGAEEPQFYRNIMKLEAVGGHPSADIRLTTKVNRQMKHKLSELGLDPNDTTASELYHALQQRVAADDAHLVKCLRMKAAQTVSAEADIVDGIIAAINELPVSKNCYVMKTSSLKVLMKAHPPKRAMKRLGYRSLASFLKHEPAPLALAAAWLTESETWRQHWLSGYKQLTPHDFESRTITLVKPATARWQQLGEEVVHDMHHTFLSLKEVGVIVFLPWSADAVPAGSAAVTLGQALHELNEMRAASTYLKLCQVRPQFGQTVAQVAGDEARMGTTLLNMSLPWNLVHRYYSRFKRQFTEAAFEPYVQLEDIHWQPLEQALAQIDPALTFWRGTEKLGLLDEEQRPVSMNFLDAALNYCNSLPLARRIVHYFQHSLWQELLMSYLQPEPVEQAVAAEMQPELINQE